MPKKRTGLSDMDKRIIRLMAKHSMCLAAVSDEMHYHGNTVRYHVDIIRRDTGKDASQFYDLVSLLRDLGDLAVEKPVRGRWVFDGSDFADIWKCTACGEDWYFEYDPRDAETLVNYCPNCGAKMDLEGGEGDGQA